MIKNVISISGLGLDCFEVRQKDGVCTIFRNKVSLLKAICLDDYYVINGEQIVLNLNISNRIKIEKLNSSCLWHYRLDHIGKDCIAKFHKGGYLGSFNYESFKRCESCLEGKLAMTPFTEK